MKYFKLSLLSFCLAAFVAPAIAAENPLLTASEFVKEKKAEVIHPSVVSKIGGSESATAKVWVFFTDKQLFNQKDFDAAAAKAELTTKAMNRRSKMGLDKVVFADIPVVNQYVETIVSLGGKLRRVSRWLNAASFEIDPKLLSTISELQFVYEIKPLAGYNRVEPDVNNTNNESFRVSPPQNKADALDYGNSWGQMSMINAHELHLNDINGQGVVVAIFDTGFFKDHDAFAQAISEGRLLAEYDFINNDGNTQNEGGDASSQHSHGTKTWSALGGFSPGHVIGPAFGATFILCKTEDVTSETQVEEDNWVAALEWVDSLGADIVSSSLGYSDWYSYSDLDGVTATTTVAANTAAGLGILICNSAGNNGSASGTLNAPADAFDILTVGAVDSNELIAYFSSRGPTFDGRIKPEVCAQGVQCALASPSGASFYTTGNGTSFSCPLVGGVAAVILSAHPEYTPQMIRKALMETADKASFPGNAYGWGIINAELANDYGADFTADTTFGMDSLTVQFSNTSTATGTSQKWYFGDGYSSMDLNPQHTYTSPGIYDVELIIVTDVGTFSKTKTAFVGIVSDTIIAHTDSVYAGSDIMLSIDLNNAIPLNHLTIPITYDNNGIIQLDSATLGNKTTVVSTYYELHRDNSAGELVLGALVDSNLNLIVVGTDEVFRLYFSTDSLALSGSASNIEFPSQLGGYDLFIASDAYDYPPKTASGSIIIRSVIRGDVNNDGELNLLDILDLIGFLYDDYPPPITIESGDVDSNFELNLLDVLELIDIIY